jgi:hypothetical protein
MVAGLLIRHTIQHKSGAKSNLSGANPVPISRSVLQWPVLGTWKH